jgi:hypothetical protein
MEEHLTFSLFPVCFSIVTLHQISFSLRNDTSLKTAGELKLFFVRFEVFTVVKIQVKVFWVVVLLPPSSP